MKKTLKVAHPNVYAEYVGAPILHPQLALISYDEVSPFRSSLNDYGVYGLFIQQQFPKYLSYGTKSIIVGDRSIVAVAPGQIGGAEDNGTPIFINGWALLWSPELYNKEYPFFSYFDTDWLRMEEPEYQRISLLIEYFTQGLQHERGLPTVAWCAGELAYSARYFGDLIHNATGGTAIGYIHSFVIDQAKTFLMKGLTIGEVADLLGFSYPHHFSRLFKKVTGTTPSAFLG